MCGSPRSIWQVRLGQVRLGFLGWNFCLIILTGLPPAIGGGSPTPMDIYSMIAKKTQKTPSKFFVVFYRTGLKNSLRGVWGVLVLGSHQKYIPKE